MIAQAQEDYAGAMERFGGMVHTIEGERWTRPTPCPGWSVRDLVNHVTYESLWVPELLGGRTVAEVGDRYDGDNLGADPRAAWDAAARAAVAAMTAEGALDTTVDSSMGPLAGDEYLGQLLLDAVIHGWDLARGIGAGDTIEPGVAERLYADLAPREAELKATGVFGDMVVPPPGAGTQTRLLAVVGRVG